MVSKFNVGDRVRVLLVGWQPPRAMGVVVNTRDVPLNNDGWDVDVVFEDQGKIPYSFCDSELELVGGPW